MDYEALAKQYGGTSAPDYSALAKQFGGKTEAASQADEPFPVRLGRQVIGAAAGLGKGAGTVAMGAQELAGRGLSAVGMDKAGGWLQQDAVSGRIKMAGEFAPYKAATPLAAGVGEVAGEVIPTLPVGGAIASGLGAIPGLAARIPNVLNAIRTSGLAAGEGGNALAQLATRAAGGAITGGASAGLVDPNSAGTGAIIGGALPVVAKVAGYAGNAVGQAIKPFTNNGQTDIANEVVRKFATNPAAAIQELRASRQVVPGSMPIAAAASGDEGLSNLTRTMQSASADTAGNLQRRAWDQNTARVVEMEGMAGNPGKINAAQAARDAITDPMREAVLKRSGRIDSRSVLDAIEMARANPDNAGKTAQAAYANVRQQIENASSNGEIDSRALYAIRKEVNRAINGQLAGEDSILRYAKGEMIGVKGVIDDAIEEAAKRKAGGAAGTAATAGGTSPSWVASPFGGPQRIGGTAAPMLGGPPPNALATLAAGGAGRTPASPLQLGGPGQTGWRDYLNKYRDLTTPINQMQALDEVLKRSQTGATDKLGNLIISGPKLNTILKNETEDLKALLSPDQLQRLRNLAADVNAGNHGMTAGKALGSNTVQNMSQDALLQSLLGQALGGSAPSKMVLGNILKLPYMRANQAVMEKVGQSVMSPQSAANALEAAMRQQGAPNALQRLLENSDVAQLGYRTAPVLAAGR